MERFQVEVKLRSTGNRTFVAWYQVEAETEQDALEEAKQRFQNSEPGREVVDYTFKVMMKGA